jgi:hypothetical protein
MGKQATGKRIAIQSGRLFLERVENLVKGGAITKPPWFDAMKRVSIHFMILVLLSVK